MPIRQLLSEIRVPLRTALDLLRPHFKEIQPAWQKKLAKIGVKEDAAKVLSRLMLQAQQRNLQLSNWDSYRMELEREGKALEHSGISEAIIAVAFAIYLEACLPYLLDSRKGKEAALAVTRIIAISQFLTLSGFAVEWAANWRKLQARERHNIARDLHDDVGHNLLVLKLYLEMMAADLKRGEIKPLQSKLEEALALVSNAVDAVRRLMLDMGPAMLAQFGLLRALKIYSRQFTLRTGIEVKLEHVAPPAHLPSSYETAIYRVLQGALSNIVKHSKAKHVKVTLGTIRNSVLFMSIEDDGVGFDLEKTFPQRAFGLTAMRERIESLGGKFHIESFVSRPPSLKHGTRIEADIPLHGVPG